LSAVDFLLVVFGVLVPESLREVALVGVRPGVVLTGPCGGVVFLWGFGVGSIWGGLVGRFVSGRHWWLCFFGVFMVYLYSMILSRGAFGGWIILFAFSLGRLEFLCIVLVVVGPLLFLFCYFFFFFFGCRRDILLRYI